VSTNLTIKQRLLQKFRSRKRRRSFAEQDLGSTVAAQIYALRQKHDKMTQKELAIETGMSQARISVLENPNYRKFNVGTLQRVAAAFDVALIVRFVSFGELLDWTVTDSQKTLAPLSFDEEFSDPAIAAGLKPKNNVVPFPSVVVGGAGLGSDSPRQEASVLSYSTGNNGQAKVSQLGAQDELNAAASQRSALPQTKMVKAN
jgi:transcriptional regulator with XRE-family HTH domain